MMLLMQGKLAEYVVMFTVNIHHFKKTPPYEVFFILYIIRGKFFFST